MPRHRVCRRRRGGHLLVAGLLLIVLACPSPPPRSEQSFDEIERAVAGRTAGEVLGLLGEPDTRQRALDGAERWIWWHFTTLEGSEHPPEARGTVVHLEILFTNRARHHGSPFTDSEWLVDHELGVAYRMPGPAGR